MTECDVSNGIFSVQFMIGCSTNIRDLLLVPIGLVGVWLLWLRTRSVNNQAKASTKRAAVAESVRNDEELDRKARDIDLAIGQLEEKALGTRLHAIYKLGRIARSSPENYLVVRTILGGFLRQRWPSEPLEDFINLGLIPEDRTAVLNIMGAGLRLNDIDFGETDCDFRFINFSKIPLYKEKLLHIDFAHSVFKKARIFDCCFNGSYFVEANFDDSFLVRNEFIRAHFDNSSCKKADFRGSNLTRASFNGADLEGASFKEAKLDGADFSCALNVKAGQIELAKSYKDIKMPGQ